MQPLFRRYPRLRHSLPWVGLGEFPSPIVRLAGLERELDVADLYLKQDGLCGRSHGASKVRKLETLLGDALGRSATEVLTVGYAGSNHAAATSLYARHLGLKTVSLLLPQPTSAYLRNNLLLGYSHGAELHHYRNLASLAAGGAWQLLRRRRAAGRFPYFIPAGGSSPLGVLGYVNAAFELQDQIESGVVPPPDRIYIAAGSMGAAAGLVLGLHMAGLRARVSAVRVVPAILLGRSLMRSHLGRAGALLSRLEPTVPPSRPRPDGFEIRSEFVGPGYARPTAESEEAARLISQTEGIDLDRTYTAKALAALIADARDRPRRSRVVLFWNTFNPDGQDASGDEASFRDLPPAFHRYFREEPATGRPQAGPGVGPLGDS